MNPDLDARIRAYVAKMPVAISGSSGHVATLKVATALVIGFDLPIDTARQYLREYNQDCQPPWSQSELEHKLTEADANKQNKLRGWLLSNRDEPSSLSSSTRRTTTPPTNEQQLTPEERTERWTRAIEIKLNGFEADPYDVWEASPIRLLDDYHHDALLAISYLSEPNDVINVNCDYRINPKDGRVDIIGAGVTRSTEEWIAYLADNQTPYREAGCWWHPNPVRAREGSGRNGSFTDADVAAFRYHLFEIDAVPLELQLSFFCKINAPIAMISDSGGKSYHALVRSSARTFIEYQAEAAYLINNLFSRYGVDQKNKNPSRYSRLPGVPRLLGARALRPGETEAHQKILYLNPRPTKGPIL